MISRGTEKLIRTLAASAKSRKEAGLTLCEGLRACRELAASMPKAIELALAADDFKDVIPGLRNLERIPRQKFDALSETITPQGILILARIPPWIGEHEPANAPLAFHVGLDRLADPGNLGTVIRTAKAVGLRELSIVDGGADPYAPKVIRAAMAFQFDMRFRRFATLQKMIAWHRLTSSGKVYAAEPSGGVNCFTEFGLFENSLIVFGAEAGGIEGAETAIPVSIPMPGGAESLNVAQAATVILMESVRRITTKESLQH